MRPLFYSGLKLNDNTFLSSFFYNFSFFPCLEIEKGEKNTVEIGGKRYKISSCRKVLSLDSRDYEGYLLQ